MDKVLEFANNINSSDKGLFDKSDLLRLEQGDILPEKIGSSKLESVQGLAQFTSDDIEEKDVKEIDINSSNEVVDIGLVTDEEELSYNLQDKFTELVKGRLSLSDKETEFIADTKIEIFKDTMHKRLLDMGVNRYKKGAAKVGGFIKNICIDYYKNTSELLRFGLVFKSEKDGGEEAIVLEANDFIESVNLDNVVTSINDEIDEESQYGKINSNEYLNVVGMSAVDAMNELKNIKTVLTPDVSRWLGAVQRIIGQPEEGETFKNYLQRAMSMKSEINENLKFLERENIENSLREVVPMLYKILSNKGTIRGNKLFVENDAEYNKREKGDLGLGEQVILTIEKETGGRIDMNDYNTVSKLDAEQSMVVLKRIAEHTGKTEMVRLISQSMQTDNKNIKGKTFSEYVDSNLDYLQSLQKDIRNDLKELNINLDIDNTPANDIFRLLAKNKDKLKYTESKLMAQLFKMGGIAAPIKNETLSVYFDRLENHTTTKLHYFLRYAVPNLRKAMNRTAYNKK